jgi:hypothetical protein
LIHGKNKPEIITKLIVIKADKTDRIKRIHMRDTSHTTDINTIMNAQPSEETYSEHADFIIENSHNDVIWPQIEKIYKSVTGLTLALYLLLNACSIPVFGQIKAMTFNIRMDTPSDGVNQWKFRTKNCAALIKYNQADFIGMQEAFIHQIKEIAGKSPVILTGDFNATPDDEPIKIILNPEDNDKLIDAEKISKNGHYGPYGTFNAFKSEQLGKHIDYVFVKNGVSCSQHTTHSETWESKFPSDHFPVSAVLHLP